MSAMAALAIASAGLMGCGSAAPASAPTAAPKPAEPTKAAAPAAQSTAAPAQPTAAPKAAFPEKGRAITITSPWSAGDTNDILTRLIAGYMEKDLGTPVQVVNKPGASTQTGTTEFVKSKPDGYSLLLWAMPAASTIYLDPERKSTYARKDFQPLGNAVVEPLALAVQADSPYKTLKDFIDAAKAKPNQVKVSNAGYLTGTHMAPLTLAREAGVKFAHVNFNASSEAVTALLGGHVDAASVSMATLVAPVKAGQVRILGITGKEESKVMPGVKTMASQGYNVFVAITRGYVTVAGTPKEATDVLSAELKKVISNPEFTKKAEEAALAIRYMDVPEYIAHWDDMDKQVSLMLQEAKAEQAKQ